MISLSCLLTQLSLLSRSLPASRHLLSTLTPFKAVDLRTAWTAVFRAPSRTAPTRSLSGVGDLAQPRFGHLLDTLQVSPLPCPRTND